MRVEKLICETINAPDDDACLVVIDDSCEECVTKGEAEKGKLRTMVVSLFIATRLKMMSGAPTSVTTHQLQIQSHLHLH